MSNNIHGKGMGERPTVGAIISEQKNKPLQYVTVTEVQQHVRTDADVIRELEECAKRGKSRFHGDFYIHLELKKCRITDVISSKYMDKQNCPRPSFDQSVFRYNAAKEQLEYIWTLPDKQTCEILRDNSLIVDPSERQMLQMVMLFYDGSLYRLMKKLNNERYDSNILQNREPDKKILAQMLEPKE